MAAAEIFSPELIVFINAFIESCYLPSLSFTTPRLKLAKLCENNAILL